MGLSDCILVCDLQEKPFLKHWGCKEETKVSNIVYPPNAVVVPRPQLTKALAYHIRKLTARLEESCPAVLKEQVRFFVTQNADFGARQCQLYPLSTTSCWDFKGKLQRFR